MFAGLPAYMSGHDHVSLLARACGGWWGSSAGPLDSPESDNVKNREAFFNYIKIIHYPANDYYLNLKYLKILKIESEGFV